MTDKKEKILQAALRLFANEGFYSTSTSKIAKQAGVSEGLIFRHFSNKDGLLKAILEEGETKLKILFYDVITETDPKQTIRKAIEMPGNVDKKDYDFWKLQYKLKWELEINHDKKMEPFHLALTNAFQKLGYESPETEASIIILFIDGLASYVLKGSNINTDKMIRIFLKKYNV
ncbi:MAG: TetR/AcrR family transcriptional regulator [Draconibacterium sp.]